VFSQLPPSAQSVHVTRTYARSQATGGRCPGGAREQLQTGRFEGHGWSEARLESSRRHCEKQVTCSTSMVDLALRSLVSVALGNSSLFAFTAE